MKKLRTYYYVCSKNWTFSIDNTNWASIHTWSVSITGKASSIFEILHVSLHMAQFAWFLLSSLFFSSSFPPRRQFDWSVALLLKPRLRLLSSISFTVAWGALHLSATPLTPVSRLCSLYDSQQCSSCGEAWRPLS